MNSMIKNYMATCVEDALDSILKSTGSCTCEKCRLDIAAIALNSLPPKYVVTKKGQMYIKLGVLQKQFDVDIISAITKAVVIVNRKPRHEPDEFELDTVKGSGEIALDESGEAMSSIVDDAFKADISGDISNEFLNEDTENTFAEAAAGEEDGN